MNALQFCYEHWFKTSWFLFIGLASFVTTLAFWGAARRAK